MVTLYESPSHIRDKSHDITIIKIKDTTIFLTYQSYNASERFAVEIFDGTKLSPILSISDLGEYPNGSMYIQEPATRKMRALTLRVKAIEILKTIL